MSRLDDNDGLADAPSSFGVDLATEAALLQRYDVARLAERLRTSLDRRRWLHGAATGAVVALAVSGAAAASLLVGNVAPPSMPAPAPTDHAAASPASCPACSCAEDPTTGASDAARRDRPLESERRRRDTASQPAAPPSVDERAGAPAETSSERSRLRQELAAFAAAEAAYRERRLDDAIGAARHLRAAWPDGPLAVEAGLLMAAALLDAGRDDEARVVLDAVRADPHAAEKADVLRDLAARLEPTSAASAPVVDPAEPPDGAADGAVDESPELLP